MVDRVELPGLRYRVEQLAGARADERLQFCDAS
jgi:hypothetical protein